MEKFCFFELFWKNSSYVSGPSLSIFVALWVRGFAGVNKVEGIMSWLLGTNEISASKHDIAALKVSQGHFETAILVLHNFVLLLPLKVFRSLTYK